MFFSEIESSKTVVKSITIEGKTSLSVGAVETFAVKVLPENSERERCCFSKNVLLSKHQKKTVYHLKSPYINYTMAKLLITKD